jgi:hypothetical protein
LVDPSGRLSQQSNYRKSNIETRKGSHYDTRFGHSLVYDLKEFDEFKAQRLNNYFKERDDKQHHNHTIQNYPKYPNKVTADSIKNFLLNNSVNSYIRNDLINRDEFESQKEIKLVYNIRFY